MSWKVDTMGFTAKLLLSLVTHPIAHKFIVSENWCVPSSFKRIQMPCFSRFLTVKNWKVLYMTPYQTKRQFSRRIRIETWESSKQSWHQWSNSINHHSGLDKKNGSVESACLCIHPSINGNFRILKMEVPTIYKAYFSGLCKGISPQNMAKHMVLTYLHQLDPGDLPLNPSNPSSRTEVIDWVSK